MTFEVVGNRFGKDYDPLVTIRDAAGRVVAQHDNDVGLLFDCRFEVAFPAAGTYTAEVCDARYVGDPAWCYVLRVGDFPVARTAVLRSLEAAPGNLLVLPQMPETAPPAVAPPVETTGFYWQELQFGKKPATWIPLEASARKNRIEAEPNDRAEDATPVDFPAVWNGVLARPGDEDWFRFRMTKGESIRIRSRTSKIGSAADLEIVLWEPTNDAVGRREVTRNDETSIRDDERNTTFTDEANFTFSARVDGDHWLQVRDLAGDGGPAHTYRIDVGPNAPELALRSEASDLTLPRGAYQPLPLKLTRTGFNGPVELALRGAPPGVTLEPATIGEKETEIVCRLVAAESAAEGLATLQVVGRARIENKDQPATVIEGIAATHPLVDRQLRNKDRILYALRGDQRNLPPSLTDRIALQITPPAPFDFELPDQSVLLPKYQTADFRIVTTRQPGFDAPIAFDLAGGQLGEESEERVQIYARVPDAKTGAAETTGQLFNRILTQYQKHRIDVKGTARAGDRAVTLTRTFTLDVKPAYDLAFEKEIELLPGESAKVLLKASRVSTFEGPIAAVATQQVAGLTYPETLEFPAGRSEIEFELKTKPDLKPNRFQVRFDAAAQVNGYQESRSATLTVNVKPPPKK